MNVIDHAILIPASPEFIWRFLGDLSQNPKWQEDCSDLSFLTTQHDGQGTRWRYTTPKGKSVIIEISAWYDTLGYEYQIVEGSSVSTNQGRIRLQEIAEGTLVQWTFNYELDGIFSGLRNSIGLKRTLTNNIQDSLRNLYKLVQQETGGISTHEARAALREAPDVEERGIYQPRHPSNFNKDDDNKTFEDSTYPSESSISYQAENEGIVEPPIADDDTQPNPVIQGTDEIPQVDDSVSTFDNQIEEPPIVDDDTQPNDPIEKLEPTSTEAKNDDVLELPDIKNTEDEPAESQHSQEADTSSEITPSDVSSDIRDTSGISVFEIFGLQKPSETQEINALTDKDLAQSSQITDAKRATLQSEVLHVDEPVDDEIDDDETIVEDAPDKPQIADIPETVTPDDIIDEKINSPDAMTNIANDTTQQAQASTGLRLSLRRNMISLRNRK